MNAREDTAIVQLQVRMREDLRVSLEQSAKARRVSLNQEILDRLEYARDRKGLLAEVLRLSFGERLAGLLLALGLALAGVANTRRIRRGGNLAQASEWIDDTAIFNEMAQAATTLIEAARPEGEVVPPRYLGRLHARHVIAALGGGKARPPMAGFMPSLPEKEVEAVKELLGPVAQRMIAAAKRRRAYVGEIPVVTGRVVEAAIEDSDKNSAQHVRDAMCLRIAAGEWKPNSAIPNESELAREFGVSPETMRKALDLMESQRLLRRRAVEATPSGTINNRSTASIHYLVAASPAGDRAAKPA